MATSNYLTARTDLINSPTPTIGANYEGQTFNFTVPLANYFKDSSGNDFQFINNIHLTQFKIEIPLLRGASAVNFGIVRMGLSSNPVTYDVNPIGVLGEFQPIDVTVKSLGTLTFISLEQVTLNIDLRNLQTVYNGIPVRAWVTLGFTQSF